MRAPAAGVPGGAQRLAAAGQRGQLRRVRLHDVGAGGDAAAQGFPAGVEEHRDAGRAGAAHQRGVRADVDARRQAAAQGDRPGPGQQRVVRGEQGRPLGGGDGRARFVEPGRLAARRVGDRDRAAGGARDRDQCVPHGQRGEQTAQHLARGAAREARDDRLVAECGQHARHVDPLAAGALGRLGDPVRAARDEGRDRVGEVQRGVERDREDHRFHHPRESWTGFPEVSGPENLRCTIMPNVRRPAQSPGPAASPQSARRFTPVGAQPPIRRAA